MGKYKCGGIYLNSANFAEDAGKTVGKALINKDADLYETVANRRSVKGKLTPAGDKALKKALEELQKAHPGKKFSIKWSIYAGCNMCPCSPGYVIYEEADLKSWEQARGQEDKKIDCFIGPKGKIDLRLPKYGRYSKHG
jgi:hypothetical protein